MTGFAALGVQSAHASIIATDTFSYTAGTSLNGANGGSGWSSFWTANEHVKANGDAAVFGDGVNAPNANELAYRTFDTYSGDSLFISVTITSTGHEGNDFFALWLDNAADASNHGTSRLNTGMSSGNLMTRLSTSRTSTGPAVSNGISYQLVVSYTKSVSGSGQPFDTVTWWVNPADGDFSTPTGSVSGSGLTTSLTSISHVGFRGANNENSDSYQVSDLVIATSWNDVVTAIPEAHVTGLLIGLVAIAGVMSYRILATTRR